MFTTGSFGNASGDARMACCDRLSQILDFGAGTGLDAEHFASLGHKVVAYDTSKGMLEVLRQRCSAQINEGSVMAVGGPLSEASTVLSNLAPFDAVLSNFAVFSTIPDLEPVFELLSKVLRKGGLLLILIQNPGARQASGPGHFGSRS